MYQALYRKWRPRSFDDVIGQKQVTETLKNQIAAGRSSHAYIFVGTRGTGKTTCAKILSRALNCEHPVDGNPCNQCASCRGIEDGSIMDVVEIDAASNNGVENVRALREEAVYTPASVRKRVYIIDEVHMLSTSAFNALLKILEEPPEHLVFILATTELHKVPPTILSRCQRYSFRRISPEDISGRLAYVAAQEGLKLSPDAAAFLGRLADGSMRDGLSLLDQCSGGEEISVDSILTSMGLVGNFRIGQLMGHISRGDAQSAIELFQALWSEGKAPVSILNELASLLRDIMMTKAAPKGGAGLLSGGFDDKLLSEVGAGLSLAQAMGALSFIQDALGRMKDGRDQKVASELCILGLCRPELADTNEQLGLRISKLEKALAEGDFVSKAVRVLTDDPEPIREAEPIPEPGDRPPFDIYDGEEPPPERDDEPPFDIPEPPVREAENHSPAVQREPEQKSAPAVPKSCPAEDGDIWEKLCRELRRTLHPSQTPMLTGTTAQLSEDKLTVYVSDSFKRGRLEKNLKDTIAEKAAELLGKHVRVDIQIKQPTLNEDMLNRLAQFDNVEIK